MKAVGYTQCLAIDAQESLIDFTAQRPSPEPHDILVRVAAVSVNPVDTKIRANRAPDDGETAILGWDACGTVESVGNAVTLFAPGDTVWYAGAIDRPGSNAEYQIVDERIAARKPETLSIAQAAAMPLTTITAWELLFDRFNIGRDDSGTLLIIGAAGGVGSMMIQLAKSLTKLTVIATASRAESRDWVTALGADHVINHHEAFAPQLNALGVADITFVASLTGTEQHQANIAEVIAPQGHVGLIDDPASFDIMPFKPKSVSIHWEFMYTRSLFATPDMAEQHRLLTTVANMIDAGTIKTTLNETYGVINAANLKRAHALIESGKATGKIVLEGFA
ncbi:MAG: zinc-binding alcohol dehydrogenase family protein [Pseudomonadota bacterium]